MEKALTSTRTPWVLSRFVRVTTTATSSALSRNSTQFAAVSPQREPISDPLAGIDLPAGCQTLDGAEALAFVRQRKQEAQGDLGRTRNQQRFLAALARKAATPSTLADPSKSFPTLNAGLDTLIVDEGTELPDLMQLFEALRKASGGGGRQLNVPVADPDLRTSKGSAVKWDDRRARALFEALREDRPPG